MFKGNRWIHHITSITLLVFCFSFYGEISNEVRQAGEVLKAFSEKKVELYSQEEIYASDVMIQSGRVQYDFFDFFSFLNARTYRTHKNHFSVLKQYPRSFRNQTLSHQYTDIPPPLA